MQEAAWATAVDPLVKKHHWLLVTLLLLNAVANEALPLFLDKLVPSWLAVARAVHVTATLLTLSLLTLSLLTLSLRLY